MARKAALFCATFFALLLMAIYGHGAQTASAQGTIPQVPKHPSDFIIGTNSATGKVDNRYTLTVTQNIRGDIELYRVIPSNPQSHTFNTFLLGGSYKLIGMGEECTGFLDEARTSAEFDYTQKFAMIFSGTPVVVNPAAGANVAWIWFQCLYETNNPVDPINPSQYYTGTLEENGQLDSHYVLEVDGSNNFMLTLPADPKTHSYALLLRAGQYTIHGAGDNCTLFVDELRTNDPWDHTQKIVMNWDLGNPVTVTTADNGPAWARLFCVYGTTTPVDPNQPITPTVISVVFLPVISTEPAEIVYALAGLAYTGTVESTQSIDPNYTLRWLNNGEIEVLTPDNPETFTIAFVIWRGENFFRMKPECKVYVDEQLTGDAWNQASQVLSDKGNGVKFTITPKTGDVAWASMQCVFNKVAN